MANWKKMVEAFARALKSPSAEAKQFSPKYGEFIKTIDESVRRNALTDESGAAWKARARGFASGVDDNQGIPKTRVGTNKETEIPVSERQAAFDDLSDFETDNRLKADFERAFDEAAENHGYKDAVQRSREEIIKALQQNADRDVTDVLRDFGYIFDE